MDIRDRDVLASCADSLQCDSPVQGALAGRGV